VLSPDEIERLLAEHRFYLETEYHRGHRANFSSADLVGRDFSGLIYAESRWTAPYSEELISAERICKGQILLERYCRRRASTERIYRERD
jgi:hypothetical protein